MNAQQILDEVRRCGAALVIIHGRLKASPPGVLPGDLKVAIRERAAEIKVRLLAPAARLAPPTASARAITPDSRSPIIPPEVRVKIENIEGEARAKGWPAELLYNANFWDSPRGLAAVLEEDDEIVEVSPDHIAILKVRRDLLRFRRHVG
jgi:hypothetical protein